jgi:ABC-type cobalamin/Fe3+-siderophores transport system ATPase subunit
MKVIIVGAPGSGKTTLLHKIIRMNPLVTFQVILDGIEAWGAIPQVPNLDNMCITAQTLEAVPQSIRLGALVLRTPDVRMP